MPLRGESVGSAYVRIYADGTEVPGDIRDSLEEAEPSVREAGRRHGETYGDEFDKSLKGSYKKHFNTTQGEMFDSLNENLTDSLARLELADRTFGSKKWHDFLDRLENEFGAAGRLAGKDLEREFRDSFDPDRLADQMQRIGPRVRAAQKQILESLHADALAENARYDKRLRDLNNSRDFDFERNAARLNEVIRAQLDDAYRMNQAYDERLRRLNAERDFDFERSIDENNARVRAMYDEAYRMHVEFNRREKEAWAQHDFEFTESARRNEADIQRLLDAFEKLGDEVDKIGKGKRSSLGRNDLIRSFGDLDRLMHTLDNGLADNGKRLDEWGHSLRERERELARLTPQMTRLTHTIERGGDAMGRVFGKGSRNNFLNFFGTVVGGLASMFSILPRTVGWLQRMGQVASEAAREGGGLAGLAAVAAEIGPALLAAAGGVVAFVGFLAVLSLVLGPVVSVLSGLLGIVVALASSLVFSVGALGAFLPLVLPIAGIIGGIILAVAKFKKDAGPLGEVFDDLKNRAKRWVDVFGSEAFKRIDEYAHRVTSAFHLGPLFDAAGKGFNRFLDQITRGFETPFFGAFIDRFERFLPSAEKRIGQILANLFSGIGGVLQAAIPISNDLLDNLVDITSNFADWANSGPGQAALLRFFSRAEDSAAAIGDFLESAAGWLGKLIDAGKGTGDNIFHNMADDFQRWSKWLDDHPHAISEWFDNAESLSHDIGHLVDQLNHFFDVLDTRTNRVRGNDVIKTLVFLFETLSNTFEATNKAVDFAIPKIQGFVSWLGWFFSTIGSGLWWFFGGSWAGALVDGLLEGLRNAGSAIAGALGSLWDGIKGIGGSGPKGGIGANIIDVGGISKSVVDALGSLNQLPGAAARIAGQIGSAFSQVPGAIRGYISSIPAMVSGIFGRLPAPIQTVVRQIVSGFTPLATGILSRVQTAVTVAAAWFTTLPTRVAGIPGQIVGFFTGLAGRILSAIGSIDIGSLIHIPSSITIHGHSIPLTANGGLFDGAQMRVIAEAGPEAVVPLRRPLSQVDPAVRSLSAYAQGLDKGTPGNSKTIDASGWQILTPSADPRIVAVEVLDEMVGRLA